MDDRTYWLFYLNKVAKPVIFNLANDRLKIKMTVQLAEHPDDKATRSKVTYLEALGRTLSEIVLWVN